jgi:hypothetical protein
MPAKSGASHGLAAFVALLVGTIFSRFLWDVLPPLGEISLLTMELLNEQVGMDVPTSEQFAGSVVIMMFLSFFWGVAYHFQRH